MSEYRSWGPDYNFPGCKPEISMNFEKEIIYDEIWGSPECFQYIKIFYKMHYKLMREWTDFISPKPKPNLYYPDDMAHTTPFFIILADGGVIRLFE